MIKILKKGEHEMSNFDDQLDAALEEIMNFYGCDNPIDALIKYAYDYEEELREEILADGGTEEDVAQALEEEYSTIEIGRMIDPEIASTYNKLAVMIKKYPKRD